MAGSQVVLGSGTLTVGNVSSVLASNYAGAITGTGGITLDGSSGLFIMAGGGLSTYSGPTDVNGVTLQAGSVNAFFSHSDVTLSTGAVLNLQNYSSGIKGLFGTGTVSLGSGVLRTKWRELSYRFCRRHHRNSSRQWFDTARIRHDHPYRIRAEHLHRTDNHQYGNNAQRGSCKRFFSKLCRHT